MYIFKSEDFKRQGVSQFDNYEINIFCKDVDYSLSQEQMSL